MNSHLLPFLFLCFSTSLSAQSILNGSFETTTAPLSCNYNLSNAVFSSYMSNVVGYGTGQELDILRASCYNSTVPDGVRFVGLADSPSDEIAMEISPALVAGQSYTLTFWSYAELSFRPRGDIQLGLSTSSIAFGTLIFTGTTVASTWTQHSVTFTAPNNSTQLTVRNITDGLIHWNHVDDFRLITLLPIHIQKFTGILVDDVVQLDWKTESELNNDYFLVQKSHNAQDWEALGKIMAAGSTNIPQAYQFLDPSPFAGINYYRLQQIDFDGNISYSNILAIEYNKVGPTQVEIYPNPSSGILNIRQEGGASITSISIIDALGQQVKHFSSTTSTINISELAAGFYWIKLQMADGNTITKRVILEQ